MTGSPRDANFVPGLIAKSSSDNTPVILEADPITKRLKVDATSTIDTTGLATSDKQDTLIGHITTLTKLEDSASTSGDAGIPMLAVRQLSDTTSTDTDGDYTLLKIDEEGRLKTSSKTASFTLCSGVLTTTAASASSTTGDVATAAGYLSVDVRRASNVVLHVKNTGGTNQTAGNFTFEASVDSTTGTDGTWFAAQVVRSNANTVELTTGTLTLNAGVGLGYAYEASVNAYSWFRIRVNINATTGSADTWTIIRGSYATEPIPAMQTHAVTISSGTTAVTMAANATTTPAKARDVASGANDTGIPAWFVRRDTPTAVTPVAGDWEPAQISSTGEQWVRQAGEIADDAAFTVGTTRVLPVGFLADETSPDSVDEGDTGIARMTLDRKQIATLYPSSGATDGALIFRSIDLDETEEEIKATAGNLYGYFAYNAAATTHYIKFYNATAASVSVGTTTPVLTFPLPAGAAANISFAYPISFSTAICAAATTGIADNDTGAPAANAITLNAFYK